jgi:FAD/FMN-containing dehydrogenase
MPMALTDELAALVGSAHVLTGEGALPYGRDWLGQFPSQPRAVVRPASTAEVARVLAHTYANDIAVVPIGGNTGLTGASHAEDQVMLSLERLNRIREVRVGPRIAIAEAGVVLSRLHDAADAEGLVFPLTFGARGSAMLGGALSTNAGGSNVLRYGSTRGLVLGIEAVLPDGRVMSLMSELHKDNSGYALKDLLIGAEGTLGVITAAVLRLSPKPLAYATALVAMDSLAPARALLNRLQDGSGGAVEAFEYMPDNYMTRLVRLKPDLAPPFPAETPVSILVEIGATARRDATPGPDGTLPVTTMLTGVLADMAEAGLIRDATIAASEAQRRRFWQMREVAAELTAGGILKLDNDICLPLDAVESFLDRAMPRLTRIDPGVTEHVVGHLGDGNLHFTIFPSRADEDLKDRLREAVEELVQELGGSFSAEHGIGLSKLSSMRRRKDPVALDAMRAIKSALDPKGLMNPGKLLP